MPFNESLLTAGITLPIVTNQEDFSLADALIASGIENPAGTPFIATVLIDSGIVFGGIEGPAFDAKTNIHPDSILYLINGGNFYGYGGRGGAAEGRSTGRLEVPGSDIGNAVSVFGAPGGQGQGYSNAPKAGASATLPAYGFILSEAIEPAGNTGNESAAGLGKDPVSGISGSGFILAGQDYTDRDDSYSLDGGDAISIGCATYIVNNGNIWAGGGGGQSGSYWTVPSPYNGSFFQLIYPAPPIPLAHSNGASADGGDWGQPGNTSPANGGPTGVKAPGVSGYAVRTNGFPLYWLAGESAPQVKGTVG